MGFAAECVNRLGRAIQDLLQHPCLQAPYLANLSESGLHVLALEYNLYCQAFPRLLCAVAAAVPDDEARLPLIQNLWEEHGEGNLAKSHRVLFQRFMDGLRVPEEIRQQHTGLPSTIECIGELTALCTNGDYLSGMGALGPGTELFTSQEYQRIVDGLERNRHVPAECLEFWRVHIECDDGHYALFAAILDQRLKDADAMNRAVSGARRAVQAERSFWDGVYARIAGLALRRSHPREPGVR